MREVEVTSRPGHPIWYQEKEPELLAVGESIPDVGGPISLDLEELIERRIRSRLNHPEVTVDSHLGRSKMIIRRHWYDFRFHLYLSEEQEEPVMLRGLLTLDDGTDLPWRAKRLRSWCAISEWLVEEDLEWR